MGKTRCKEGATIRRRREEREAKAEGDERGGQKKISRGRPSLVSDPRIMAFDY